MAGRFVIHAHSGHGPLHYDLMLHHGEALATWQLPRLPEGMRAGESMPARRLGDHRLAYLTYQGPVSGGRGEVKRVNEGTYELLEDRADCWRVRVSGRQVKGIYRLQRGRAEGDDWTLTCEEVGGGGG